MPIFRFEWDDLKNITNLKKHNISFEDATAVFSDPLHLSTLDTFYEEERWKTVGLVDGYALIVVVHTYRDYNGDEVIRIISARRATRFERQSYERENY